MTPADALLLAEECDRLRLQAIESENRTGQDLETFRDRALALDEQAKVATSALLDNPILFMRPTT